jgi:nicotinamidase/pyrazinamidase
MKALLLIDLQNDFVPGGALPVPGGDKVVTFANRLMTAFDIVVATQDWHPSNHGSFASNHSGKKPGDIINLFGIEQVLWPDHCVQNTFGADFVSTLDVSDIDIVFKKGTDQKIDSYSGFFDNGHKKDTGLDDFLKQKKVTEIFVMGIATDYCVKFTCLDALKLGYKTYLIKDACRGVELNKGDIERALKEIEQSGASIINSSDI